MNQVFDPINLVLLVVAIIVAWRLWSVLGTRTGHEKRIDIPLGGLSGERSTDSASAPAAEDGEVRYGLPEEEKPVWEGVAEENSLLARMLERMKEIAPEFDARHFLEGAKVAYEMIVTAFARGDTKTLKPLLAPDVYAEFEKAIEERRRQGLEQEFEFVGLDEAKLLRAALNGKVARLTVRFVSRVITVTRDADGNVISGSPDKLATVKDVWTFERDLTSRDPNWRLVSTEAPAQAEK